MEEKNDLKIWWSILGKWQVLAVVIALAVFYITRHIRGDYVALAAAALAATAVASVASVVVTEVFKISKKIVYLSCTAEFVVILLPILGTVHGWW